MEEVRNEAAREKCVEMVVAMLSEKISHELIAKISGLTLEEIDKIEKAITD